MRVFRALVLQVHSIANDQHDSTARREERTKEYTCKHVHPAAMCGLKSVHYDDGYPN